jgi:aspartate kinase
MKVFKFGGASVKDADAVKNMAQIVAQYAPAQIVIVVSAMGKTTNALEATLRSWYAADGRQQESLAVVQHFHTALLRQLFPDASHPVFAAVAHYLQALERTIAHAPSGNFDFDYDQMVSVGELLSSLIIGHYLNLVNIETQWCDARRLVRTDDHWREGNVNWPLTAQAIRNRAQSLFGRHGERSLLLTQGFIGGTKDGHTTTLGREGSDYTAAIFSHVLDAEEMTVWKDVPGVFNADPKIFADPVLLPHISYGEAIELTYYGATIIHPKTIKPLQNKKIPLRVRSFLQPEAAGTSITETAETETAVPSYIVKNDQWLISLSPKNFSFIAEQNLSDIFAAFAHAGIRIHMMQISAISFTACVSHDERKINTLFERLNNHFSIKYNTDLQLLTIRHWTPEILQKRTAGKTVLLEQRNRTTAQICTKTI